LSLRRRQDAGPVLRGAAYAALLLVLALAPGCSDIALPKEDAPADAPESRRIAGHLKSIFKDRAAYDGFEISGARWVHGVKGWSWLTCVRFKDHDRMRAYAVFSKDNAIVDGRYAVQTDACDVQAYSPFDLMSGSIGPAGTGMHDPLY